MSGSRTDDLLGNSSNWAVVKDLYLAFEGPVLWTGKRPKPDRTEPIRTGPDRTGCSLPLSKKKTDSNRTQPDRLGPVATGLWYPLKIRTFWAYFEEKRVNIAWVKTICFGGFQHSTTSRNCIIWVLEGFYHHKNFIGSNYTLYTIVYSMFYLIYTGKILVLLGCRSNWFEPVFGRFEPVFTGFGPVFFVFPN